MSNAFPDWFAADETFRGPDGWYIGTRRGFHVGPYAREDLADRQREALLARLERCSSSRDGVKVIRDFLQEQSTRHGCRLASDPPEAEPEPKPDMPAVRAGEEPRVWFRTSRFFSVDDVWFFATRENIDVGPYATREEAERDASRLLDILSNTTTEAECRLAIHQFQSRPRSGR